MKKIFITVIVVLMFVTGCTNTSSQLNSNTGNQSGSSATIPFLAYYQDQNGKIDAKLSLWNIDQGTVTFSDELVYSAKKTPADNRVEPITWDGDKKLLLHKTSTPEGLYKAESKVIEKYTMDSSYGRDITAVRNLTADGKASDYDLFLNCPDGVVKKKIKAQYQNIDGKKKNIMGEGDVPCNIDFDRNTGEIRLIFHYYEEEHGFLYIGKCNIADTDNIHWKRIVLPDALETGGGYIPTSYNTVLIDSTYYLQSGPTLTEVDIDTGKYKVDDNLINVCKSMVQEGSFVPDHQKRVAPVGVYNDILILRIQVSGETNLEHLMCAVENGEFKGAIHIKNDEVWKVINSEKKVVSIIDNKNKELYKEFDINFIAFPNLNGN